MASEPPKQEPVAPTPAQLLAEQYGDNDEPVVAQAPVAAGAQAPGGHEPPAPTPTPAVNAAGRPYDPSTGQFLPSDETPPNPPPAPAISPHLLRMAEDFGIDPEGLTEDSLAATVRAVQRSVIPARRQDDTARAVEDSRGGGQASAPEGGGVGAGTAPAADFDPIPELRESDWQPELINPIKAVVKKLQRRIDELEGSVRRESSARASESNTAKLDRAFAALDDARLGGKATRADLADDDPSVHRRSAVVQQAVRMAGPRATTEGVCAMLKKARDVLYEPAPQKPAQQPASAPAQQPASAPAQQPASAPAQQPASAPAEKRPTQVEWDRGGLGRPSHRQGAAEPDGYQKAVNSVAEAQREARQNGAVTPDVDDEFPD